jgi:hypothetical protein
MIRFRPLRFESLEGRQLMASLWQNPGQHLDVNRDLAVDKRDLDVVLAAQRRMNRPLSPRAAASTEPYYDASGDGKFDWTDYSRVSSAVAGKKPVVAADLASDTDALGDRLTSDPTIRGRVSNWTANDRLQARLDGGPWSNVSPLIHGSAFTLGPADLATVAGSALGPVQHVLELRILRSNKAAGVGMDLAFQLLGDAIPPPDAGGGNEQPADPAIVNQVPWTGNTPPGVVIDFEPASSRRYIGSPSIVVLPGGEYIASHDLFGPGTGSDTSEIFISRDQGRTWQQRATLRGQVWSTLFVHEGQLYLLGTDRVNGAVVIRRSGDGGSTWTTPTSSTTGRLLTGRYSTGPTPVIVSGGRIWRAVEAVRSGSWGLNFLPFMLSAPVGANLLQAASWTSSNRITPQSTWLGGQFRGFLEGNAVAAPGGGLVNVLRVHSSTYPERAALIHISANGRTATFNPATDFVSFPGGTKKFTIRFDEASQKYWALANDVPVPYRGQASVDRTRNTLSLVSSADLRTWQVERVVLQHANVAKSGFQYADWQFESDDLIAAIRTAYREPSGALAASSHDSNYLTFLRVKDFRGAP